MTSCLTLENLQDLLSLQEIRLFAITMSVPDAMALPRTGELRPQANTDRLREQESAVQLLCWLPGCALRQRAAPDSARSRKTAPAANLQRARLRQAQRPRLGFGCWDSVALEHATAMGQASPGRFVEDGGGCVGQHEALELIGWGRLQARAPAAVEQTAHPAVQPTSVVRCGCVCTDRQAARRLRPVVCSL